MRPDGSTTALFKQCYLLLTAMSPTVLRRPVAVRCGTAYAEGLTYFKFRFLRRRLFEELGHFRCHENRDAHSRRAPSRLVPMGLAGDAVNLPGHHLPTLIKGMLSQPLGRRADPKQLG